MNLFNELEVIYEHDLSKLLKPFNDGDVKKFSNRYEDLHLDRISRDQDYSVKIQAVKLVALLARDEVEMSQLFESSRSWEEIITTLFKVDEEYPLKGGGIGEIVVESLTTVHRSWIESSDLEETQISDALVYLMDDESEEISQQAADCVAQIALFAFFKYLADLTESYKPNKDSRRRAGACPIRFSLSQGTNFAHSK